MSSINKHGFGQSNTPKPKTEINGHRHFHIGTAGWIAIDYLLAAMALTAAHWLSPRFAFSNQSIEKTIGIINLYALCVVICAHVFGLHDIFRGRQRVSLAGKSIIIGLLSSGLLNMVVWFGSYGQVGRYVQIITCVFTIMGLYGFRILLWRFLGGVRRRVIILCDKGDWTSLLELVREKNSYYKVVGLSGDISRNAVHLNDPALLDSQKSILQHCRELSVHEVLFSREDNLSGAHREELVNLLYNGVTVRDYLHFMEHDFGRVPIEYIGVNWFFRLNTTGDYYLVMALKRQVDILLASIGLILSLPLLFIAAILIKMESLGPVFYPQIRVGEFGRPFRIWKLRSMRTDAEADGPHWAAQNDKRVTRVGRILRKTRIDELPQFWNILRGDMSWIGPRPERPEFIAQLEAAIPFYGQRHRIKPGLTGWAQINYPYGSSLEDSAHKLSYDLYYLNNLSTLLDIHIFLRTIGMIMRGAR